MLTWKKLFFFILIVSAVSVYAEEEPTLTSSESERSQLSRQEAVYSGHGNEVENLWAQGKKLLYSYNIHLGADVSLLAQRAAPSGKQTAFQAVYYPYLSWQVFEDTSWGSGEVNVSYTLARYWGVQSTTLQSRTRLAVGMNNFEDNQENFEQLSYTHTLPGSWDFLSVIIGQYPLDNFDGSQYVDNQQTALIHYSLSQNASAAYPDSSFGAYVQAQNASFTLAAGYQDASNLSGAQVRLRDAFAGEYTTFGAFIWTPRLELGDGQYGFLFYRQPRTNSQADAADGWSFNIQQNIGNTWAVFARLNGSTGNVTGVKQSYALGGVLLNPFARNENDAVIAGIAHNRLSREGLGDPDDMRTSETALELQWVWGIGKLLTITPDLQIIPRSGLSHDNRMVTVFGLRTTVML